MYLSPLQSENNAITKDEGAGRYKSNEKLIKKMGLLLYSVRDLLLNCV